MVLGALTGLRGRLPVNVGVSLSPEKHAPFSRSPRPGLRVPEPRQPPARRLPPGSPFQTFPGTLCRATRASSADAASWVPPCGAHVGTSLSLAPEPRPWCGRPRFACVSVCRRTADPFLPLAPINRAAGNKNSRTSFCADMFSVLLVSSFRKTPGFLHINVIKNASCVFP